MTPSEIKELLENVLTNTFLTTPEKVAISYSLRAVDFLEKLSLQLGSQLDYAQFQAGKAKKSKKK